MAGEVEEEVVLRFTVKGSEVSVRQISNVRTATEKLETTTAKSAKKAGDAWDRYQRSTERSLSNVARRMGAPDVLADHMAEKITRNLDRMSSAWRTGGDRMGADAARAGASAAASFEQGLMTGLGGTFRRMRSSVSRGLGGGKLGTGLKVAGGAAGALAGGVLAWGTGGMQGASDQIEYRNRIDSLYGKGTSDTISPSKGSYDDRQKIARSMGLSNTEYLGTFGGLSQQLLGAGMTKPQAQQQAGVLMQGMVDMSSFTNLSNEEGANAIQAVLRGEYDSAERLGVMLNQSAVDTQAVKMFGKKTTQLDTGQQVQARLAALQASAGWTQSKGDFQRSLAAGSLEGQKKVAAATMANTQQSVGQLLNTLVEALLPIVDPLAQVLDWVIKGLKPVIDMLGALLSAYTKEPGAIGPGAGLLPGAKGKPGIVGVITGGGIVHQEGKGNPLTTGGLGSTLPGGFATGGVLGGWSPGIDNQLVPLSGGEGILTPETVAMMGGANAINGLNLAGLRRRGGYANGTAAAAVNAMMGGGGVHARSFASGIYVPGTPAPSGQASDTTTTGPGGVTAQPAGEGVYPADAFLALTQRIMAEKGMDPGQAWMLLEQAKHESSLRINPPVPDDVNMHNGAGGSWGILQFVKDTFSSYADPGHTNFLGVEDQIRAALNYVPARYGGPGIGYLERNGFGPYDSGGWLQPGMTQAVNKTGKPEAVLTDDQWDTMKTLAGGGGAGGVNVTIQAIHIGIGAGGADLASTITDELGDAIAARINRANDRRL